MKLNALKKAVPVGMAICVAGCATAPGLNGGVAQRINNTFNSQDPCSNNARNTGMLLGGIAGALIGAKLGDKDKGAMFAGALLGTAAGGFIGADMDKRRCELVRVAREHQLQMTFAAVASNGAVVTDAELSRAANADEVKKNAIGNVVSLQDGGHGGHFESNSDVLTTRAEKYFSAIADIYNQEVMARQIADPQQRQNALRAGAERKLLLVGHTDDTGSSNVNAALSERRARAVAQYLERRGIPRDQVYYQGAGEVYPSADNNTDEGRVRNRRVEIVELSNAGNFSKYLEARRPNYQFYRAVQAKAAVSDARAHAAAQPTVRTPVLATKAHVSRSADVARARSAKVRHPVRIAAQEQAAKPASTGKPAPAASAGSIPVAPVVGSPIDFGGSPLTGRVNTAAGIGKLDNKRSLFSLISNAYANEMPVLSDCSQDRPRISGAVKALKDGATYKVTEHVPGLYGKSWTERVNGHQIVINKVAVLASEASLAQIPELKVYANYDPARARNPKPDVALRPEVNTYLGEGGILYRIFTNGAAGIQCVDILYKRDGGSSAKGGNIVYVHDNRLYVAAFKPVIAN